MDDFLTKEEWLVKMSTVFEQCGDPIKTGGYMAVFIGDIYRDKTYHIISAELAHAISKLDGWVLKANLVWFDQSKFLHIYGYPHAFVPSMIHQNILIFRRVKQSFL